MSKIVLQLKLTKKFELTFLNNERPKTLRNFRALSISVPLTYNYFITPCLTAANVKTFVNIIIN